MCCNNESDEAGSTESLIALAIESWRFAKMFERVLAKLDAGEQKRHLSQYKWFLKKMEESLADSGLKIAHIEGQTFDPGIAATALNIDESETDDVLVVEQMLEPIIMNESGLVRSGTVILRKVK